MKKIAILGSTGSIGTQTLEVVRENKDIEVSGLAAGNNIERLEAQIREFAPKVVAVWSEERAKELADKVRDLDVKIVSGMEGLIEVSTLPEVEILVTAIVGMIGIRPTIAAITAGKHIALANKETLVTAGHIIMPLAKEHGVSILHNLQRLHSRLPRNPGHYSTDKIYLIFSHRIFPIFFYDVPCDMQMICHIRSKCIRCHLAVSKPYHKNRYFLLSFRYEFFDILCQLF